MADLSSQSIVTEYETFCCRWALDGWVITGSGHLRLARLLADPAVDFHVSPYSCAFPQSKRVVTRVYSGLLQVRSRSVTDATEGRVRTGGMLPMLPVDSASLHAKLFLTEDDTRTHFCNDSLPGPGGCDGAGLPTKATGSLNETIELLARNVYTAAFHRSGEYFFDLFMKGWFGRPDKPAETAALWSAIAVLRAQTAALGSGPITPQVAVLVDDASWAYLPLLGGAANNFGFNYALGEGQEADFSTLGAPVSYYLVSDILSPSFPSDQLRLLIFTNAFALSDALRSAVSRLQGGERTLVWWYAPGIIALENSTADAARISALVGIAGITRGAGAASLSTRWSENCSYGNATIEGLPPWHADPWFYLDEHAASAAASVEVLGRYVDGGAASLVRQSFASHTAVFSGAPGMPMEVMRALAKTAGVHLYVDAGDDVVDGRGSCLMVHAGATRHDERTVRLPHSVASVAMLSPLTSEAVSVPCAQPCTSFQTPPLAPGASRLFCFT